MTPNLRELYQEVILDHTRRPRNKRVIDHPTALAEGHNRLCGDKLTLYVTVENGVVTDASFQGGGCAISTSSASLMTDAIKGKTVPEVHELFRKFHELVTGGEQAAENAEDVGKLAVFLGVREFPVRVKCATLAWHTLEAALAHKTEPVTTEQEHDPQ